MDMKLKDKVKVMLIDKTNDKVVFENEMDSEDIEITKEHKNRELKELNKRIKKRKLKEDLIAASKFGVMLLSGMCAIILMYLVKDWTINDNSIWSGIIASITIVGLNVGLFILGKILE